MSDMYASTDRTPVRFKTFERTSFDELVGPKVGRESQFTASVYSRARVAERLDSGFCRFTRHRDTAFQVEMRLRPRQEHAESRRT
jgi:hypothetical protein